MRKSLKSVFKLHQKIIVYNNIINGVLMLIGITGESGCGKSEIAKKLALNLNGKLLLIDEIGHSVVKNQKCKAN